MKDKDAPLSDTQADKARSAAKAAGRPSASKTDERDAVKADESNADQPKNTGDPNKTGTQEAKKAQRSEQEGRRSPDESRHR